MRDTDLTRKLPGKRDIETVDSELRLLAAVRWSIREQGGEPSSRHIDALLDERRELTEWTRAAALAVSVMLCR